MPSVHSQNEQDGWKIILDFTEEGGKMDQIVFGENSFSSDSIDRSDVPDPGVPPTPPYVNAYFTTPFLYPHTKLMHEYKHYSSNNPYKIWNLTLIWQGNENTNITITWNLTEYNKLEYDTILLCNDTNIILKEMLINNTYTFSCSPLIPQFFKIKCILFYTLNFDINGNGNIEVNKNGPYEYGDIVTLEAIPSSGYTFSKWSGDHLGRNNPTTITIDSNKSITANFVKDSSGGSSGGGGVPPPMNIPPVAYISVDEPYIGVIGEDVTLNGSLSYDQDGSIASWHWDFGDGSVEKGEIITHSYMKEGNYTVILTVTDNIGSINKDTIYIDISPKSNIAPNKPTLKGPNTGNINVSYTYDISALDADNDHIKYVLYWGDNTNITTDYLPSGTNTIQNHTWITPGRYNIWVQAIDNKNESSDKTFLTVLIDIMPISDNKVQGYLIDEDSDGIYDIFYNQLSKNKSKVGYKSDDNYLIDINNDDKWDYVFDVDEGELKDYDSKESEFNELHIYNIEVTIIATLSLLSLIICLIIIKKRNKKKNKSKK